MMDRQGKAELLDAATRGIREYLSSTRGANRFHPAQILHDGRVITIMSRGQKFEMRLQEKR